MKVFIYCRVSTRAQSHGPQERKLVKWARAGKHQIVGAYEDSTSRDDRPGLKEMFGALDFMKVDAIVVVRLDRLARSPKNFFAIAKMLEQKRVGIICVTQEIDTTKHGPCGGVIRNILAAFNSLGGSLMSERTKAGLVANGKTVGRFSTRLIAEPERSEVVGAWLDAGGIGIRGLAKDLGGISFGKAKELANEMQEQRNLEPLEIE